MCSTGLLFMMMMIFFFFCTLSHCCMAHHSDDVSNDIRNQKLKCMLSKNDNLKVSAPELPTNHRCPSHTAVLSKILLFLGLWKCVNTNTESRELVKYVKGDRVCREV